MPSMQTVTELFTRLGRDRITREAGHKPQVLSRAAVENVMPSGWYPSIRSMCETDGIPVPEHLFRWRDRRNASEGDAA